MDTGWTAFYVHVIVVAIIAVAATLLHRRMIDAKLALTICVVAMAPTFWVICAITGSTAGITASWVTMGIVVACYELRE